MTMIKHTLYLHGFASSPQSKKANFFCERFRTEGYTCDIPDLNVPSFEQLTLTAMTQKVAATMQILPEGNIALIGSSMGGLTAVHFIHRFPEVAKRVTRLILMAPALDFIANRDKQMGDDGLDSWQKTGKRLFFHYAHNRELPVHYGLVEDVQQYDSYAVKYNIPTLIFHGKHDESVNYHQSVRFADQHNHVALHLLDSDHQLLDQTEFMWQAILEFIAG